MYAPILMITKQRSFCKSAPILAQELRHWFNSSPGRDLLALEQQCLEQLLSRLFGYYLLHVGCLGYQTEPLFASRIRSQFVLSPDSIGSDQKHWITGSPMQLPIASESMDVVVLAHALDFSQDPHQVLREMERVLIPEGRVIILGFNPWSLWGLRRLFCLDKTQVPWCGYFLSRQRINDWLSLLGFEVQMHRALMFCPPIRQQGVMERLAVMEKVGEKFWPPLSGVYAVQAVKRVSRLTPVKPMWKLRARVQSGRIAEPTARSGR